MKLEREDTKPLDSGTNFSSLLQDGSVNLSFSRINTSDLNALEELVGIDPNQAIPPPTNQVTSSSTNEIIPTATHQAIPFTPNETVNGVSAPIVKNEQNVFVQTSQEQIMIEEQETDILSFLNGNLTVPINWSTDIDVASFPENTITEVNTIVRGLTLPASTSADTHGGIVQDAESSPIVMPPSLNSWPGIYNFNISIFTDSKDRNRVSYSDRLNKLFICPNYIVPVSISLTKWEGASITVVPVFKQKQYQRTPVTRCPNCKGSSKYEDYKQSHIIHIEDELAEYQNIQDHYAVTFPLTPPSLGESTSTILLKSTCLTSCQGGPYRRPFFAVFIVKFNGEEVGRQSFEIKCCRCPGRDKDNDEKELDNTDGKTKKMKVHKIKISDIYPNGKSKKRPKTENDDPSGYTTIRVRKEYESEIKKLINKLEAEKYVRQNIPNILPYPEEGSN